MKKIILFLLFLTKTSLAFSPQSITAVSKLPLFILADYYSLKDDTKKQLFYENLYLINDFVDSLLRLTENDGRDDTVSKLELICLIYDIYKLIYNLQTEIPNKDAKTNTTPINTDTKTNIKKNKINLNKQRVYTALKYFLALSESSSSLYFSLKDSHQIKKTCSRLNALFKVLNLNIDNKNTKIDNKFVFWLSTAGTAIMLVQIRNQLDYEAWHKKWLKDEEERRKKWREEEEHEKLEQEKRRQEEISDDDSQEDEDDEKEKQERIALVGEEVVNFNDHNKQDELLQDIPENPSLEALQAIIGGESDRKECPSCCEEYKAGDNIFIHNDCHHALHLKCALDWLHIKQTRMEDYTCPNCRRLSTGGKAFRPQS